MTVCELNVAAIPAAVSRKNRHQGRSTALFELVLDCMIVTRKVRVAVQNKETVAQCGKGRLDCPGCATQPGAVKGKGHAQTKLAAVTHRFLDHLAEVTGADDG